MRRLLLVLLSFCLVVTPLFSLAETWTVLPAVHEIWGIPWGISQDKFVDLAYQNTGLVFHSGTDESGGWADWSFMKNEEIVSIFGYQPLRISASFKENAFTFLTINFSVPDEITDTGQIADVFNFFLLEISSRYALSHVPYFYYVHRDEGQSYMGEIPLNSDSQINTDFLRTLMQNEPRCTLYLDFDNIDITFRLSVSPDFSQFFCDIEVNVRDQYANISMEDYCALTPDHQYIGNYMEYIQNNPSPIPEHTATPASLPTPSPSPTPTPVPTVAPTLAPIILDF